VVSLNNLGGCNGSTGPSINPATGKPYGADFPVLTVEDWVHSQARLADRLGIHTWAAVIGGSLGGMQALQWTITYPDRVRHRRPSPRPQAVGAEHRLQRSGAPGHPHRPGLPRRFVPGPGRDPQARPDAGADGRPHHLPVRRLHGRKIRPWLKSDKLNYDFHSVEFQVESYLRYQGEEFSGRFDANTYLLMTKAHWTTSTRRPPRRRPGDLAHATARLLRDVVHHRLALLAGPLAEIVDALMAAARRLLPGDRLALRARRLPDPDPRYMQGSPTT
jgi:homoserine O-acetyltransferase